MTLLIAVTVLRPAAFRRSAAPTHLQLTSSVSFGSGLQSNPDPAATPYMNGLNIVLPRLITVVGDA